jgi:hypothetical protein
MTNLQEMLAGTDPAYPMSRLVFESTPRPADLIDEDKTPYDTESQFAFYIQTVAGKNYEFQSATALGSTWHTEVTFAARTTQKRVVIDKPANLGFYRVVLVP